MNTTSLDDILREKSRELESLLKSRTGKLVQSLKNGEFNVIAEVKRHSPSVGNIGSIPDPVRLAREYELGGAAGISVLTDKKFFHGSIDDMERVAKSVKVPILRKDFLLHPYQIAEAYKSGASAVLLIVAALKDRLKEMLDTCDFLGLDALVEIHDVNELYIAKDLNVKLIGVNNRDLKTMEVDLKTAEKIADKIPANIVKVAESGIKTIDDVRRMKNAGYDAVLIGEALVVSSNPAEFIRKARNV